MLQRKVGLSMIFMILAIFTTPKVIAQAANLRTLSLLAFQQPTWEMVNQEGFGTPNNVEVSRLNVHEDYLYASTQNNQDGAEIWRSKGDHIWTKVASGGFGNVNNFRFHVSQSLNGYLYVGTHNTVTGGEIVRCSKCDGSDWVTVVQNGLTSSEFTTVQQILLHGNILYATVDGSNGIAVWRTTTGDAGTWSQVNTSGFDNPKNTGSWSSTVFNGRLYVATSQFPALDDGTATGTEVWRCATCTGSDWEKVNTNGFGTQENQGWWAESFNNALYVSNANVEDGVQIWRCSFCNGTDWQQVNESGFGDAANLGAYLIQYDNRLFAATTDNWTMDRKGVDIWVSNNGTDWDPISVNGWGDVMTEKSAAGAVYNNQLYFGTTNYETGGQVWLMQDNSIYLPLIMR